MSFLKHLVMRVAEMKVRHAFRMLENQNEVMEQNLFAILRRHRDTIYGRRYDFSSIHTVEEYSRRVPLVDAYALRPYLEMIYTDPRGKVLTSDPVYWYLQTSGTTGRPKRMPITRAGLRDMSKGSAMTWMFFIDSARENADILDGTLVTFGAPPVLDHINGIPVGYATGVYARHQNRIFQRLIRPGEDVFNIRDMDAKMEAYAKTLATENVTALQGITPLSLAMVRRMQSQYGPWLLNVLTESSQRERIRQLMDDEGHLDVAAMWPNLRLFLASGIDTEPYVPWIKKTLPNANVVDIYGGSEGVFAGQLFERERGMQLFANTHYFEFIPESEVDEPEPEVIPLSDVKVGHRYELVFTNIQGYYRYRIGDMVTISSTDPYSVCRVSRRGRIINLAGEKISDAHVAHAIASACRETGAEIIDYSVIGLIERGLGHYTIVALFHNCVDGAIFCEAFESAMKSINEEFRVVRETGALGPTVLRIMNRSYIEHIMRNTHLQAKPVTVSDDPEVLAVCEE